VSDFFVRSMCENDLAAVAALQEQSAEASHWAPADYLRHQSCVAEAAGRVIGFLVLQDLGEQEAEILNLVVEVDWRRRGVARGLLLHAAGASTLFLEVRESNAAARAFYRNLGFQENGRRRGYYRYPSEDAILMMHPSLPGLK
jgi:ribosomal-protein-alanine N-acetyltransferase